MNPSTATTHPTTLTALDAATGSPIDGYESIVKSSMGYSALDFPRTPSVGELRSGASS